jgi:hypothetical protein
MLLFRNTKQDYTCITADIRKIPKKMRIGMTGICFSG